jgi:hypothetical protein
MMQDKSQTEYRHDEVFARYNQTDQVAKPSIADRLQWWKLLNCKAQESSKFWLSPIF